MTGTSVHVCAYAGTYIIIFRLSGNTWLITLARDYEGKQTAVGHSPNKRHPGRWVIVSQCPAAFELCCWLAPQMFLWALDRVFILQGASAAYHFKDGKQGSKYPLTSNADLLSPLCHTIKIQSLPPGLKLASHFDWLPSRSEKWQLVCFNIYHIHSGEVYIIAN